MQISAIQTRVCTVCKKEYSLNLFRPDGDICRYCEAGRRPPRDASESINGITSIREENVIQEKESTEDDVINTSSRQDIFNSKILDEEIPNFPEVEIEKAIEEIYKINICEINIILGCLIRWDVSSSIKHEMATWISNKNTKNYNIATYSKEDNLKIIEGVNKKITNTSVDVTAIKASIRTLLHTDMQRRKDLIKFYINANSISNNNDEPLKILEEDLIKEGKELGYPIPILPETTREDSLKYLNLRDGIISISRKESTRKLAVMINKQQFKVNKESFKNQLIGFITQLFDGHDSFSLLGGSIDRIIEEGMVLGFLNYGIDLKEKDYSDVSSTELIIDLNDIN